MTRADPLEQRRRELVATVALQRLQLRMQWAALRSHVPRLGGDGSGVAWPRAAALALVAVLVAWRPGAVRVAAALAGSAALAVRLGVFARTGWRFAGPWLTRLAATRAAQRSSP